MMINDLFTVSLVITTYNRPDALELVLRSVMNQTIMPTEVIIADDGSSEDAKALIAEYRRDFSVPLFHCWQEDKGFRVARARNLAVAQAKSDYIIVIDGDMILHRHFIRDHQRIAQPNQFVQGRRVILTEQETKETLKENLITFNLFSSGVKNKANAVCCCWLSNAVSGLFSKKDHKAVRSCNMAFWRADAVKVNGFNEDFTGWGREDSEFVVRLLNAGIRRKDLRFGGVAYHLHHKESPRTNLLKNDRLLEEAINNRTDYCQMGISQHLN